MLPFDLRILILKRLNALHLVPGRYILLLLILCLNGILCVSCSDGLPECEDELGCVTIRSNEPIQLAYLLPLTGPASELGESIVQGVELGVAQVEGTLLGHPLTLRPFDSGCSTITGQRVAQQIVSEPDLVAVIGPACSEVADGVALTIQATGGVMVSPSTTAVNVPNTNGTSPSFFRVIPDQREQANRAAQFAIDFLNIKTAVIFHEQTDPSQALRSQFEQTFQEAGGVIITQQDINIEEEELTLRLNEIIDVEPDLIFLPLQANQANFLLNKLVELNTPQTIAKIGTSTLFDPQFPIMTGNAANGLYVTGFAGNGTVYHNWLDQWEAQTDTPLNTAYPIFATDAVLLLIEAIEAVATTDNSGNVMIGRQALRDALASAVRFEGATGRIACAPSGDCGDVNSIGVYQINDAQIAAVRWPPVIISR